MTLSIYGSVSNPTAGGTHNLTLAIDGTVKAVVLCGTENGTSGAPFTGTPTYGGVSLTQVEAPQAWAFETTEVWALLDLSSCVGDTLSFTLSSVQGNGVGVAVSGAGVATIADSDQDNPIATSASLTLDPSPAAEGLAIGACCAAASVSDGGGQIAIAGSGGATWSVSGKVFGSSPDSISFTKAGGAAGMPISAVLLYDAATVIVPDVAGAEAGIVPGFTQFAGDPVIFGPVLGMGSLAGIPAGFRISANGPAQAMLSVPYAERPQTTEGGVEGDVLTYHANRKPTWEAPGASAPAGLGPLLLASDHSTPIVFEDILQASDGDDFLYASEPD